jgi:uncharacterized cupin superfamily protein
LTDLGGGIYVSRVDSEDWELDPEVGGSVHVLFEDGETAGGLWKLEPDSRGTEGHELPARETIVVLKGTVRIEIRGGPTLELGIGDMASMPKGSVTTWHPSADFKEIWFYS